MDKQRALLALQRRRQQEPEIEVLPPQPVHLRKRIVFPDVHPEIIAFSAVLIAAIISLTIIGSLFAFRGIIYELRRNPDSSSCLVNCND